MSSKTLYQGSGHILSKPENETTESCWQSSSYSNIWASTTAMFTLLLVLVWLNEFLDLPHLLLGAPPTPINWQESVLEMGLIIVLGFFNVSKLIFDTRTIKRAENALSESEAKSRSLIEATSDCVWETDITGAFTYFRSNLKELLGYTPEEFTGKIPIELLDEEEAKKTAALLSRMSEFEAPFSCEEVTCRHRDGHKVVVEISGVPIFDEAGSLLGWRGFGRDITEQRRVLEDLRVTNEKFSAAFRFSPEAIAITSRREGQVIYVNDHFLEMSGYERDQVIGKKIAGLNLWADKKEQDRFAEMLRTKGVVYNFEMTFNRKSDSPGIGLLSVARIDIGDQPYFISMLNDISRLRKLETRLQQAQKMEAIGTLAGGIAHDFNNLLQAIMANTELAQEGLSDEKYAAERLEQVIAASNRARKLVRQILTFSRQGKKDISPLRMGPVVKEALNLLRSSLPSTIEIRQNIQAEQDTVLADPTQINQIMMNLCTNAAYAMREKGGVLEINLTGAHIHGDGGEYDPRISPGHYIKLTIRDTGHGMNCEDLNRVFEPFFTTKKLGEGTGMGLSVVHGIVKSLKGEITVESEPEIGTRFQVLIPAHDGSGDRPMDEVLVSLPRGKERILVVDDEDIIVDPLKPILENLGYHVVAKTNSVEALDQFFIEPDRFDLVISDQTMPYMTGAELSKKLIAIRPDIPIILCSGFSELITPEEARAIGIRDFLIKPLNSIEIAMAIRRVLDKEGGGNGRRPYH